MPALLDTNVLVHAANSSSLLHSLASSLLERGLRTRDLYCIAPQNLVEFAAVLSRPRWQPLAMPGPEIERIAGTLYRSRRLSKIYPKRGTVMRAMREGAVLGISGPLWYDLFLAVTMRDAGVYQIITDNVRDFSRIPFVHAVSLQHAV